METNDTYNLKLQITLRLSHNSMSIAVGDPKNDGKIAYEPYPMNGSISAAANLREAFSKSELLQSGYKKAIVLADSHVMLVPKKEYDEQAAPELYKYTIGGHDKDDIARVELPELESVAIFSINRDLRGVLTDHFESINLLPVIVPVWRHLYHKAMAGTRRKLFAYFHDKKLDIFRFERGRFRYANTFDCEHAHDALYYILYVWKLLGMNNAEDELHLAGNMPHGEWLTGNIAKFLQRTFIVNPAADFNLNEMAKRDDIPYDVKALYL